MLEDWQGPSSVKPAPIANKDEEGGISSVEQGKTAVVKKSPKGKCHGYGMVNDHFLSDFKVVSKEAKKMIMYSNRQ